MIARMHRRWLLVALTSLPMLGEAAAAQQGSMPPTGSSPLAPQQPETVVPGQPQGREIQMPTEDPLHSVWLQLNRGPAFQGFPVFPSRLSGYGSYPTAPGQRPGLSPFGRVPLLVPAAPETPGWPSWVRTRSKEPLPYAPDRALLIRHSDRVWYRDAEDPALVPLFPHDKFRTLVAGAEIEVRQKGGFELLLHDSTRMTATGPTRIKLVALGETDVGVEVTTLTRLAITAGRRAHTISLPDGSELRVAAPTEEDLSLGPAELLLERTDEPGWFGGRATLSNRGKRSVQWHFATGDVTLAAEQRATLFLTPPQKPIGAKLQADGIDMQSSGGVSLGQSTAGGDVRWGGASFRLPAGAKLRLESLQGDAFAPVPASAPGPSAVKPGS